MGFSFSANNIEMSWTDQDLDKKAKTKKSIITKEMRWLRMFLKDTVIMKIFWQYINLLSSRCTKNTAAVWHSTTQDSRVCYAPGRLSVSWVHFPEFDKTFTGGNNVTVNPSKRADWSHWLVKPFDISNIENTRVQICMDLDWYNFHRWLFIFLLFEPSDREY